MRSLPWFPWLDLYQFDFHNLQSYSLLSHKQILDYVNQSNFFFSKGDNPVYVVTYLVAFSLCVNLLLVLVIKKVGYLLFLYLLFLKINKKNRLP